MSIVGGIVASFAVLIGLTLLFGRQRDSASGENKPTLTINYDLEDIEKMLGRTIDEEAIPDSSYFTSYEDAIEWGTKREKGDYRNHVDEIIKQFESEQYVTLYFKSIKDEKTQCFTMAKFRKKEIEGETRYAFLDSFYEEVEKKEKRYILKPLQKNIEGQLTLSDYERKIGVDPNKRFVYGFANTGEIYKLKIEGQEPTEIIPYMEFDEQWYLWYYEDLDSDVPGPQLKVTLE